MRAQGDEQQLQRLPASRDGYRYAIRVQGHLDAHWSEWLDGMAITHEEGGASRIEGVIVDQAALRGLMNKLWDMCLTVLALQRLGAALAAARGPEELPESAP